MPDALMYESHMHTVLCKHARGQVEDYARVAAARNLRGVIVTCHNPLPDGYSLNVRMAVDEMDAYLALVERARAACRGRVEVRLGLECDYYPGVEPWLEKQLRQANFEYVLGSVHPNIGEYQKQYFGDSPVAFVNTYYQHMVAAAQTGYFDTLAHPDIIKNIVPEHWRLDWVLPIVEPALDQIARTGVALELNTSGVNKTIPEMNPGPQILRLMCQRGIPVVIGADAHDPERVGDGYEKALHMLREAGYRQVLQILNRQRKAIDIHAALASLAQPDKNAN